MVSVALPSAYPLAENVNILFAGTMGEIALLGANHAILKIFLTSKIMFGLYIRYDRKIWIM